MRAERPLVALLLTLTLLPTLAPAKPVNYCGFRLAREVRQVERRLARGLRHSAGSLQYLTREIVAAEEQDVAQALTELPITTIRLSRAEQRSRGLTTSLQDAFEQGDLRLPDLGTGLGTLYRLTRVGPEGLHRRGRADLSVFFHPETPVLLRRLRELGVAVYIDSSLRLTDDAALYDGNSRSVSLGIEAAFHSLRHETTHAEFDHFRVADFLLNVNRRLDQGRNPDDLLTVRPYAGFGAERLRRVIEMARLGYPLVAIDEGIAVESEFPLFRPNDPNDQALRETQVEYALLHLLTGLATVATERPLTPAERLTFHRIATAYLHGAPDAPQRLCPCVDRYGQLLRRLYSE